MTSCEEDLTKANGSKSKNFPSQIINNANIIQRDSGFISLKAKAPIIEKYELIDSPYVVARKGINIEFFDKRNLKFQERSRLNLPVFLNIKNSTRPKVM